MAPRHLEMRVKQLISSMEVNVNVPDQWRREGLDETVWGERMRTAGMP